MKGLLRILATISVCVHTQAFLGVALEKAIRSPQLSQPRELRSHNGKLEVRLRMEAALVHMPNAVSFKGRTYNGQCPGPTIRVRAGDTLTIHLENALSAEDNDDGLHNDYHRPNTTNIHTHGLHVSPLEDNIELAILPGESRTYTYHIPSNHMGGTHWYHPHYHGSATAAACAAGALIVEDAPSEVPLALSAMPEAVVMMQPIPVTWLDFFEVQSRFNSELLNWQFPQPEMLQWNYEKDLEKQLEIMPVNGHYRPEVVLQLNVWTRVRIVFASWGSVINATLDGDGGNECEMVLLAKDGVYIFDAPRPISRLLLVRYQPPMNRCPLHPLLGRLRVRIV